MSYFDELKKSMEWLAMKEDTVFLGQSVAYPGNSIFKTLEDIPKEKRWELPIMEDCQLGMCIGLSMVGKTPICIYPRMDFLMLAMNQLVNHLDKEIYPAKVIIRTCVGSSSPLDPGVQHKGDYTQGLRRMLENVRVVVFNSPTYIQSMYERAYNERESFLMIEKADLYGRE